MKEDEIRLIYLSLSFFDLYNEYKRLQEELNSPDTIIPKSDIRIYLKVCGDIFIEKSRRIIRLIIHFTEGLTKDLTPENVRILENLCNSRDNLL